jgi:hypothetical protein
VIPCRRRAARSILFSSFPEDAFDDGSDGSRLQPEILAELQHRPGQPGILRGDGHYRTPVATPFGLLLQRVALD